MGLSDWSISEAYGKVWNFSNKQVKGGDEPEEESFSLWGALKSVAAVAVTMVPYSEAITMAADGDWNGAFKSAAVETGMAVLGVATGGLAYGAYKAYKIHKVGKKLIKAKSLRKADDICALACFVAGTQVLTKDGYVDIEQLEVGDEVWATDIESGESDWKAVTKTWTVEGENIYQVTITTEDGQQQTIDATDSHPFYVVGKGWIETIDLIPGDTLVDKDQGFLSVESVVDQDRIETAYNLTVADYHTYYVTERNVLVHNCNKVAKVFGKWINRGKKNTTVYIGVKNGEQIYVGITKQALAKRQTQHGKKNGLLRPVATGLTRNQARAVEQALIVRNPNFNNIFNSVSPRRKIYNSAVKWGEKYLSKIGL